MKKLLLILIIIFIAIFSVAFLWWQTQLGSVDATNTSQKIFVVSQGENMHTVGNNLENAGLIKNSLAFYLLVKWQNLDNKIQSGDFRLSPSLPLQTIAQDLTHGSLDYWITIPEGKRAEEIADILQQKAPNYSENWRQKLDTNEGYLFPDSYLIPTGDTIDDIIALFRKNFDAKYATLNNTTLSQNQLVTVASLVERESRFSEDRPLVASVIYNRLKMGMALQIDPTVQYGLGYNLQEHTWWKKDLTVDDLQSNSPYNTYHNPGLPPTPIGNPGLSSLQAAANPAKTDYIYYLSDSTGHLHFSKTLDEHNANIAKYHIQ
jgi:UPF0755 protein